ncbi:hypothetical protein W7S_08640 [Mycobacterium sp. MOTT36Y]|nr:hypothetical protein [Mycobacterium sp. MOTT36Y]AFJ34703.1 hypothetical protein W7S_08640 [Mycobacterium sp. MOTT36Y]
MSSMISVSAWPLVGHEGWPPNIKPSPGDFVAGTTAQIAFFFIAGAAVVLFALPWAIRAALGRGAAMRRKNYVPLLALGSGLLCCLVEPMLDMLGHLHWAKNLVPAFTNFGITVPALIPLCYVAFLGLEAHFCYFVIRNGAHARHFVMLLGLGIFTDAVMETIGINLGIYTYYGVQPFSFLNFPYWWGFINGGSFVTIGAIFAYAVPRLEGTRKLWLLLLASPTGMMINYFGVGWVHILAHNSTLPVAIRWVAATIMMAMMVGWMFVLHHLVGRPNNLPAPNWTWWRVFAYGKVTPTRARRMSMWQKMCEESGIRPGAGIASDPEDSDQALIVGPTLVFAHGSDPDPRRDRAGV